MKSVNTVILLGNVGKDPEVKFTSAGTALAKFSLATNERFKGKDGQWQDKTEWINVTCWAKLAEIAGEYVKRGSKVYVEGRLETQSWDDKASGQKKYSTSVVASELILLDGKSASEGKPVTDKPVTESQPITDEDIPF